MISCLEIFRPAAADAPEVALQTADVLDAGEEGCATLTSTLKARLARLAPGGVLEVRSREPSTREDIPAWCRLAGHELVSLQDDGSAIRFTIRKRGE